MLMRKLTAMMITGVLALGAVAPTALADNDKRGNDHKRPQHESDFKDWDNSNWANESLARLIMRGVIKGDGTNLNPKSPVTRLEASIMLSRLLERETPAIPEGKFEIKAPWGTIEVENDGDEFEIKIKTKDGEFKFEDDGDIPEWGRAAILIALRDGFLIFDGSNMSPMKPLSRLEAAIMMVKAAGLDAEAQAKAGADLDFKDENKIPERLRGYVKVAVESGFVTGLPNGTFNPTGNVTRAEWAALLDRLDRRNGPPVSADGRQIKATITAVAAGGITVTTPVYPNGVTYQLDATAVIYKGGKEITLAELMVNDQVIINLDADRQIVLLTVNNASRQATGKVETFVSPTATAAGSIKLTENGASNTYTVASNTQVLLGGKPGTFADIRTGDQVTLRLEGNRVTQVAVKVESVTVTGTLEAYTLGTNTTLPTVTVKSGNNVAVTYRLADHATIKGANGTALTIADLMVGDQVSMKVERDLVSSIQLSNAARTMNGQVVGFVSPATNTNGSISVNNEAGVPTTYAVTSSTKVMLAGKVASFADVRIGDVVTLKFEGNRLAEITVKSESITVNGTLQAYTLGTNTTLPTVTVKGANNVSTTYQLTDHTTIKGANGASLTLLDLVVGDDLSMKVERNMVTAIQLSGAARSLNGKVEAFVSPTTTAQGSIRVTENGVATTYTVTNTTAVTLAGKAATFADVRVGDAVTLKFEGSRLTQVAIKSESVTMTGTLEAYTLGTSTTLPTVAVKGANNVVTTYQLTDHATIKSASGAELTLADLIIGDQLSIKVERNMITSIQLANTARSLNGQVEAFVSPTTTAQGSVRVIENGVATTYTVTNSTKVTLGTQTATFADVRVGDAVTLKFEGARLTEVNIKVEAVTTNGTLQAVTAGNSTTLPTISVVGSNNRLVVYTVADHATVKAANGTSITLADLAAGNRITFTMERNMITAIQIRQ